MRRARASGIGLLRVMWMMQSWLSRWTERVADLAARRPLLLCLGLVGVLVVLVFAFFPPRYETNDDAVMNLTVAGRWVCDEPDELGGYDPPDAVSRAPSRRSWARTSRRRPVGPVISTATSRVPSTCGRSTAVVTRTTPSASRRSARTLRSWSAGPGWDVSRI